MAYKQEGFILTSSPHIREDISIPKIMYTVILTLLPAIIMSIFYFGTKVILLYFVSVFTAMLTEGVINIIRKKSWRTVFDGSAIITGLLLVMTLPPTISWGYVALGSFIAIFLGKSIYGGLGYNIFNPALIGRAFLAAAYPVQMTTWQTAKKVITSFPDAISSATPLASAKFDKVFEKTVNLIFGQTGGCIGETSAILIILGGLVLIFLKYINWKLVVSYLGTVFVFSGIFYLINPSIYPSPIYHLFAGGLMLGAFYMATDMVTSPYTDGGNIIFGVGAGILVVIIRLFGGFPEGVMYSILIMNSFTPLINRYVKDRVFGT